MIRARRRSGPKLAIAMMQCQRRNRTRDAPRNPRATGEGGELLAQDGTCQDCVDRDIHDDHKEGERGIAPRKHGRRHAEENALLSTNGNRLVVSGKVMATRVLALIHLSAERRTGRWHGQYIGGSVHFCAPKDLKFKPFSPEGGLGSDGCAASSAAACAGQTDGFQKLRDYVWRTPVPTAARGRVRLSAGAAGSTAGSRMTAARIVTTSVTSSTTSSWAKPDCGP